MKGGEVKWFYNGFNKYGGIRKRKSEKGESK
jgi:hypothetical protein